MKYLALIKNIPTTYKGMLINESKTNRTQKQSLTEKLKQSKQINKLLYWTQMKNTVQTSIAREKWESSINTNDEEMWKKIYTIPFRAILDITLKSFQYKLLLRIIPTNTFLYKCKLKSSNICDFCQSYVETIEHLFWECRHVQHIWNQINIFIQAQAADFDTTKEIIKKKIHRLFKE